MVARTTMVRKPLPPIWYVCPRFKHLSWTAIGEKHVRELTKYMRIEWIEEVALPTIMLISRPLVIMHPYFYPFQKFEWSLKRKVSQMDALIGIDVADSDRISDYAVKLTEYATALIVPSNFAKQSYLRSGVKIPIHVLPHGVDPEWVHAEKRNPQRFTYLAELKRKRKLKLIHAWVLHSPWRKGLDILLRFYARLLEEYNNVLLVLKSAWGVGYFLETIERIPKPADVGDTDQTFYQMAHRLEGRVDKGWLTEEEKMELFDLVDLYVLTARGGGFEHPPLECLARGTPVIGPKGGSWEDYLPDWALVPSHIDGQPLPGNPIHVGNGVEMDIEKAVDKAVDILENEDDYKARVKEHVEQVILKQFIWSKIGEQLRDIIYTYV